MSFYRAAEEGPQPPYPMRPVGPTYRTLVDRLMGVSDRALIRCKVCGHPMIPTESGAHVACLAPIPEPERLAGPYLPLGTLVDSVPWLDGIIRAAREAEEAKQAEALKAAMPIPDSPVSEPKPGLPREDAAELRAVERRIALATKGLHKCRVCKRPLIAMQQTVHATCASPEGAWPGWTLPTSKRSKGELARKGSQLTDALAATSGPQWTDWASALAAVGLTGPATIPD